MSMSATSASAVLGRRACAVLAATSAVLHGVMVGDAGNPVIAVLVLGMAVACLYCAKELWTAGSPRVWCIVAVMNLGMIAVHWSMPGHHHGQAVALSAAPVTSMSTLMVVATSISVVEAIIATAVLWAQTRSRASSLALAARSRGAI
jgi:vacuolar-type H+-ATPase subunit I/STV1